MKSKPVSQYNIKNTNIYTKCNTIGIKIITISYIYIETDIKNSD